MSLVETVPLRAPFGTYRGVAVDAEGHIYVAQWGGELYHFDAAGSLLKSASITELVEEIIFGTNLTDIDIGVDDDLVIGTVDDRVVLTNTSFTKSATSNFSLDLLGYKPTYVAFVPDTPVQSLFTTWGRVKAVRR
jgi:hypothetical protein